MSKENVELIRALFPTPDMDLAAIFRDDNLFDSARQVYEPLFDPEFESVAVWQEGKTYYRVEGLRELWLDWLEPWTTYHVTELDELIDAGDRVVALERNRGRRQDTDVEVEIITGSVWEVRDGRVVRVEFSRNRQEALEAAGLSEQHIRARP